MANSTEYTINLRDLVSSKLNSVISTFNKVEQSAQQTDNTLRNIGAGIGAYFAIDRLKSFGSEVLTIGKNYEKLEIQFKNLTKSATYGQAVFDRLKEDAKTSPFGVEELAQANAMMMSTGLEADKARTDINNLGNAIAFAGKGNDEFIRMAANMQQIKNIGKATAVDIKQFGIAGINIYSALARSLGTTGAKVKDINVTYEVLAKALADANTATGVFANGTASMVDSVDVSLSNLGDTWEQRLDSIFKKNKEVFKSGIALATDMIDVLGNTADWISDNTHVIYSLGVAIAAVTVAWKTYTFWQNASMIGSGVYNTVLFAQLVLQEGLTAALYATGIAGTAMWAALTLGLSVVIAGVIVAYNKFQGFRAAISGIGEVFKTVFTGIGNFFKNTFDPIFKAIDYFKEGKYKDAAVQVGKLAYNLSPAGLIANGIDQANQTGGEIKGAYNKGANNLRSREYDENREFDANGNLIEKKTYDFSGKGAMGAGMTMSNGAGSVSAPTKDKKTSKAGGGSGNVVNITIGSLVKDLAITVQDSKQIVPKLRAEVEKALVSLTNDVNVLIYQ